MRHNRHRSERLHEHGDEHGHEHDHSHEHNEQGGHSHPAGLRGLLATVLRPHSHDAADRLDDALAGSAAGIRVVQRSLICLGLTALVQLAVVLLSGSVGLLADTIHNFADASTALPLWLAFSLSRRAPTRRYTYGFGRAEDLAGIFVVLMIAGSSGLAAWESVQRLLHPQPISHLAVVAAAALIGCIGNEVVAHYRIRAGQRIGSAALVADGYHARTDGLTSLAVLLGAAGVWLGFQQADALIGLAITVALLFILKGAAVQVWQRLMDAVDPALVTRLEHAAASADGVQEVSEVRLRWLGHSLQAEARVTANCDLTLAQAHVVAEEVRHAMMHALPKLGSVTIHTDPCPHRGVDPHAALLHHDRR